MSWREVNPLAFLAIVSAAVLAGLGQIPAEAFLTLVSGLAIPAGRAGYQGSETGE